MMSVKLSPSGNSPVNVALVNCVAVLIAKSSAVSISILPADDGRLAAAILPSGSPVLKKNELAFAQLYGCERPTKQTAANSPKAFGLRIIGRSPRQLRGAWHRARYLSVAT